MAWIRCRLRAHAERDEMGERSVSVWLRGFDMAVVGGEVEVETMARERVVPEADIVVVMEVVEEDEEEENEEDGEGLDSYH